MITTFIKRAFGVWLLVLLPALSYAEAPSGHYENHFGQPGTDIWDLTGTYSLTDEDWSLYYSIVQDDKGKISGQGAESFTYYGSEVEWYATVSGSVKSIGNVTRAELKGKLVGTVTDGYEAWNIKGKMKGTYDIDKFNGLIIGNTNFNICAKGEGCRSFNNVLQLDIPGNADGSWNLVMDIQSADGKKLTGTASAILSNGRTEPLALKGKYNAQTDLTKLKLKGSGGKFTIQAQVIANQLVFQSIKGKLLGQTVNQ